MKSKSLVLLIVAMGCGLIAMLGVQQALKARNGDEQEQVEVLVAVMDIPSGLPLDDSNTEFKLFPKSSVPDGAVLTYEQYEERALKSDAVKGEMIMMAKLGEKGVWGASSDIPKGMRVVTVSVNDTTTHAGQMSPGDRVDVIVTYDTRDSESREMLTKSRTILEYIRIFSVGNKRDGLREDGEASAKNVSLLVTLPQAQLVMLAKNKGTLHLAMRSKLDDGQARAMPIDDRVFEDWEASFAQDQAPAVEEEDEEVLLTEEDVREALADEQIIQQTVDASTNLNTEQAVVTKPEPEPEKPVIPTWKVTVFSGSKMEVISFPMTDADPNIDYGTEGAAQIEPVGSEQSVDPHAEPEQQQEQWKKVLKGLF